MKFNMSKDDVIGIIISLLICAFGLSFLGYASHNDIVSAKEHYQEAINDKTTYDKKVAHDKKETEKKHSQLNKDIVLGPVSMIPDNKTNTLMARVNVSNTSDYDASYVKIQFNSYQEDGQEITQQVRYLTSTDTIKSGSSRELSIDVPDGVTTMKAELIEAR